MKRFIDYYEDDHEDDYDPIEEYENGVKLFHLHYDYDNRNDYCKGIKRFQDYYTEDTDDDDYGPYIRHFRD